jgi:hypothetical protein
MQISSISSKSTAFNSTNQSSSSVAALEKVKASKEEDEKKRKQVTYTKITCFFCVLGGLPLANFGNSPRSLQYFLGN